MWKFKVCTLEILKFQNFKSALKHINGYNVHDVFKKKLVYITLNSSSKN
jgi:hypothetical protein